MTRPMLAYAGDVGYWYPFHNLHIPVRVLAVADTARGLRLSVKVTAQRQGHGYVYRPNTEHEVNANAVRPKHMVNDAGWYWCTGERHFDPCRTCRAVHRVTHVLPAHVMGGALVPATTVHVCRCCGRRLEYERATR